MTAAITRHDALTELSGGARLLAAGSKPIRRGALVCIAAGATLLVAASMTGSTASAAQQPAPIAVQPGGTTMMDLGSLAGIADIVGRAVASAHASPSASAHQSKHTAPPPTPADISGLAANGIPNIALNAYRVAAARLANLEPGCGVDWALLAGIGRVESDHGRFQNAVINADGTSTPPIIGPALNGHGTALIPAPANGLELAGDAVYTHALGPMQFIPQTWAIYGADASGDGVADIFNINDAALGAARYLCAAGGNLTTPTGQDTAVLAYNHLDS